MTAIKMEYQANVIVAGWISLTGIFFPKTAQETVFSNGTVYSEAIRLGGTLWGAVFILSIFGFFYLQRMSLVLLFQLIYNSTWLLFVAIPAITNEIPFPKYMAIFFIVWVFILPFVIP